MDKHYAREEAFVLHLVEKLKLDLAKQPWNPNANKVESGVDVGLALADGRRVGVQVTELDPYPEPGARGRERAQARASASGVYVNYVQNDAGVILDAICRAIERKVRIIPAKSEFSEVWLLLCVGLPDAPTSTFIPTAPLSAPDLDTKTTNQLLKSEYMDCFILPFFSTEQAIYRWSKNGTARWRKSVHLEEIPGGTGDAEYVRELLRTRGTDEGVVDARVRQILDKIGGNKMD
jgi:hypothetical protein